MSGIDGLGALLVSLALALMSVSPLHFTIARSKVKTAPISASVDDRDDGPASEPEPDDNLANDPLIAATEQIARIFDQA
jgi:hypothetical protein